MDPVNELSTLVGINSVFPNEGKICEYLSSRLAALGFTVRKVPLSDGRYNVVGERGSRGAPVLLYAHVDTVPPYGAWNRDPFSLSEENGRLYGLGAYDMKAGIASILHACEATTDRRLRVVFGVDEENDSQGAWALSRAGEFNGVDFALVPEINDSPLQTGKPNVILLGRRGRTVYEFKIRGTSSHGANVQGGANALDTASRLTLSLSEMNSGFSKNGILPPESQFVRKISGENTSLSLPESASVELDRHIVPPRNSEAVLQELKAFVSGLYSSGRFNSSLEQIDVSIKPRQVPYLQPYLTARENHYVQLLSDSIFSSTGMNAEFSFGMSVADENVIAATGVPTVSYGCVGGNYHSANEWVDKESFLKSCEAMKAFVKSL